MPNDHPELISAEQAAVLCSVSFQTFRRMKDREGFPPCVRLGRLARWNRDDVLEWARKQTTTAPKPS